MARAGAAFIAGLGLGAGLMYFLDPDRGSRRRTRARNQVGHTSRRVQAAAGRGRAVAERMAGSVSWVPALARARGRTALVLASAAGIGLAARAVHARNHEFELRP
jgi:hypothetical protein